MIDISSLFSEICKHMETKSEYFDVFIEYHTRFEGWFEAEILKYILDKLPEINIVSTKKKFQDWGQPDIVLKYQNMTWIIELKVGVIGGSRNYNFYLVKYKVGAGKDFERISKYDEDATKKKERNFKTLDILFKTIDLILCFSLVLLIFVSVSKVFFLLNIFPALRGVESVDIQCIALYYLLIQARFQNEQDIFRLSV